MRLFAYSINDDEVYGPSDIRHIVDDLLEWFPDHIIFEDTRWDDVVGFSAPDDTHAEECTMIGLDVRNENGYYVTRYHISRREEELYPGVYSLVLDRMVFELEEMVK